MLVKVQWRTISKRPVAGDPRANVEGNDLAVNIVNG